jgi:hypothetical protein
MAKDPEIGNLRWVRTEEAPFDDGSPTGRWFREQQRFTGYDHVGEEEWEPTGVVRGPFGKLKMEKTSSG